MQSRTMRSTRSASRSAAAARAPVLVRAAKTAGKGFGAVKPQTAKDGCPCGSGKFYKECCKPYHKGEAPESLEAAVRARFSAVPKREVGYLMRTFHPEFHAFHYGTAPGGAGEQLQQDMERTCQDYEYSNLRIMKIEPGDRPNEQYAEIQYIFSNRAKPDFDQAGNRKRLVRMEKGRFLQEDGVWRFVDYQMADVPEALARAKDKEQSGNLRGAAEELEALAGPEQQ